MSSPTHRRRNRIVCLHGPTQSAASFRAALKPVCDRMDRNWEFHFLDAPFIIADPDNVGQQQQLYNIWVDSAILSSQIVAIDAELSLVKGENLNILQTHRDESWQNLNSTKEGRDVWKAQMDGGADGVESLISGKVAQSMCRDWVVRLPTKDQQIVGVDVGLGMIGDYMREQGNFHGAIGYDSGSTLSLLIQALLSHPRSSTQTFPTFFAQLPKGMSRMPRMGGWEEEPPASDDARLGKENLPKDYVPVQKPLEAIIAFHSDPQILGSRVQHWLSVKQPILKTANRSADPSEEFINHSLAIQHIDKPSSLASSLERCILYDQSAYIFDKDWTMHMTEFLNLAIESGQGNQSSRQNLHNSHPSAPPSAIDGNPTAKL